MIARVKAVVSLIALCFLLLPVAPAAAAPWATATATVGKDPQGIAVLAEHVFVANAGDGTVSVWDEPSSSVVATIRVGRSPSALAADAETGTVYVVNTADATVSVIDADRATPAVVSTIKLSMEKPSGIAVDSFLRRVFVSHPTKNAVSVIDVSGTKPALSSVRVGSRPGSLAVAVSGTPSAHKLLVSNAGSNTISVLNLGSGRSRSSAPSTAANIGVCREPSGTAVDARTNTLYVACGDANVQVVDLAARSVVQTYEGTAGHPRIALATAMKKAFVVDVEGLRVIDLVSKKVTKPAIATRPVGVAVNATGDRVYLADYPSGQASGSLLILSDDTKLPSSRILTNTLQPVPSQTFRVGPATLTGEGVVPPNTFPFAGRSTDDLAGIDGVTVTFVSSANSASKFTYAATVVNCDDARHECTWVVHKGPPPPGVYRVNARAVDRAGNVEAPGPSATVIVAAVSTRASNAAGIWGLVAGLAAAAIVAGVLTTRRRRAAAR